MCYRKRKNKKKENKKKQPLALKSLLRLWHALEECWYDVERRNAGGRINRQIHKVMGRKLEEEEEEEKEVGGGEGGVSRSRKQKRERQKERDEVD